MTATPGKCRFMFALKQFYEWIMSWYMAVVGTHMTLADALSERKRLFPAIFREIQQIITMRRIFNTAIE